MNPAPDLFPPVRGFTPDKTFVEPSVWIKELRIYREFSPEKILRTIELHPGLNILWARPRDRSEPVRLNANGVSGHGTGKTTFCRFVRHLLGEANFGTDEQRARLRKAFPEGWLVGEVRLEQTSWLICLPFKVGANLIAYKGRSIESIFEGDQGKVPFEIYRKELDRVLAEPLPVATFATSPTPIDWHHLIQWLTRDQECRFSGIAELRHTSSDSKSPDMSAEDRHFLFRAVLGLIEPKEQEEIEKNKQFLKDRQYAEKSAPLFKFRGDTALERLRKELSDFREDLEGADWLVEVGAEWKTRQREAERIFNKLEESDELKKARGAYHDAEINLRTDEQFAKELQEHIELLEKQIKNQSGEVSDLELDTWLAEKISLNRLCGHTLAQAVEWKCPLVSGQLPSSDSLDKDKKNKLAADQLEQKKQAEIRRLALQHTKIAKQRKLRDSARDAVQKLFSAHTHERAELARKAASAGAMAENAARALQDKKEADQLDKKLTDLDRKIRISQELQATIRDKSNSALSAFSETFGRISRAIVGDDITAEIRFRGRQIKPSFMDEIDLTSAALETLKIICFDLAGLISGIEGRGHHPRFLIHDGPREADMDVGLYQRIFLLMRELENGYGKQAPAFQYILTTTEPPPIDMQCAPWLLSPILDASVPGGKLLGENF